MSLGYDIAQALPGLRVEAESRMTDSCLITRPGDRVFDEDAGEWASEPATVYAGKCRLKPPTTGAVDGDAAGRLVVVSSLALHLPVSAGEVLPGDMVEVVGSETRPAQIGRMFSVAAPFDGSQTTALRYRVEAADGR